MYTKAAQTDTIAFGNETGEGYPRGEVKSAKHVLKQRHKLEDKIAEYMEEKEEEAKEEVEKQAIQIRSEEVPELIQLETAKMRKEVRDNHSGAEYILEEREREINEQEKVATERLQQKEAELERLSAERLADAERQVEEAEARLRAREEEVGDAAKQRHASSEELQKRMEEAQRKERSFQPRTSEVEGVESTLTSEREAMRRRELAVEKEKITVIKEREGLKDFNDRLVALETTTQTHRETKIKVEGLANDRHNDIEDHKNQLGDTHKDHEESLTHEEELRNQLLALHGHVDQAKIDHDDADKARAEAEEAARAHSEELERTRDMLNKSQQSVDDLRKLLEGMREVSSSSSESTDDDLSPDERNEIRQLFMIFRCCDGNKDGDISSMDLKSCCVNYPDVAKFLGITRENPASKVFESLDRDGSGGVDWEEFSVYVREYRATTSEDSLMPTLPSETRVRLAFDLVDSNKDGRITLGEYIAAVTENTEFRSVIFPNTNLGRKQTLLFRKALRKLRKQAESDPKVNATSLSFEEFIAFIEVVGAGAKGASPVKRQSRIFDQFSLGKKR
eukprot:NODE_413_length_3076_cov_4.715836.p1 GENE.NODE_413_length_3076_cov_4.715836~~NODE_413_length_3076_cov_4.715836.p1  ORF type:complete len:565 (-),score=203.35 NODE_413_length_3076_cov_4.715836:294-1988(-)